VFPPGTKSLLSKFLTREVFDELKDKVTSGGISLRVRCCRRGVDVVVWLA
jgi:hypothetical protein